MRFFREAAPNIFVGIGRLETEQDGRDWVEDYERCLAAGAPIAIIARVDDRPLPAAGKPMVLWLKARRAELGRLVKLTIYVAPDEAERAELVRSLPGRAKSAPYAMAVAASEAEAIAMARACLH
ncbi:hypothetical protein [Labrys neptuniae]